MEPKNLPIGYWIKQVDNLLTEGINEIHAANSLNRTSWQILHLLKGQTGCDVATIVKTMQPFGDANSIQETLEQLASKNLVEKTTDHSFSLTHDGSELHAICLKQQQEFRNKTMQHISAEDYEVTVNTLREMVGNLTK